MIEYWTNIEDIQVIDYSYDILTIDINIIEYVYQKDKFINEKRVIFQRMILNYLFI